MIEIDTDPLLDMLGRKAIYGSKGIASLFHGKIRAKVIVRNPEIKPFD